MIKKQLKFFIFLGIVCITFLVLFNFLDIIPAQADEPGLVKELLFTVEDSEGDAIGVKVMENFERLPPLLWYNQNVSNPANPSYFTIDGYYALRDGNTVYVGALDVNPLNYNISPYIYIFSYNEGASSNTINIFNQLLNNLNFNQNINNLTEKLELQRDLLRIYDFNEIKDSLDNYHDSYDSYPQLASGTYIPGITYSSWPSWQYSLSSELGQSLPVDPINRFNSSCSSCPNDPAQPDYQCNGSCYNPVSKVFSHPNGSHVYEYYTPSDQLCLDQGYSLYANLEYKPSANDVIWLGALPSENIIINRDDSLGNHNYSLSEGIGQCGNEILEPCEECEIIGNPRFQIIPGGSTCANLGLGSGTLGCIDCRWTGCDKLDNGQACSANTECSSGHCSDGICCDTSCQGLCQSCNVSGICQLVDYGEDPRNVCPGTTCSTGFCDGFGACELETPGISCGICKYCSIDGQCSNTPLGEDYNNQCSIDPINNCKAGYCNGYGSCSYYPEGFICADCRKCNNQFPAICNLVPAGTEWGINFTCNASGNFTCYINWDDCDSSWSNGCEAYLLTNNQHCGSCDHPCVDNQSCVGGNCVCDSDWGDCDSNVLNGCETDLLNIFEHCGSCGNSCITHQACQSGSCVCGNGWGDCDENPSNGCEIDLLSTFEHCGSCGNLCSEGKACSEGICVDPLPGQGCSGQPAGTSCGYHMQCNASSDCICQEDWGDCNNDETDGCETNLLTNWLHCDMCNNACNSDEICENGICIEESGGGGGW